MLNRWFRLSAAILFGLSLLSPLTAQVDTGVISGTATDRTGAILPRVAITITSAATGFSTVVHTSTDGIYVSPPLRPGRYEVAAQLAGFQRTVTEIVLEINQRAVVNLEMAVGQVTEFQPAAASLRAGPAAGASFSIAAAAAPPSRG